MHFSRTKECTSSSEQGKLLPHETIRPAQAVRALYLFARKCSKPKAILMGRAGHEMLCMTAFPNKNHPTFHLRPITPFCSEPKSSFQTHINLQILLNFSPPLQLTSLKELSHLLISYKSSAHSHFASAWNTAQNYAGQVQQ